ncbi:hypothetical protein PVAP13_5KG764900 [Panicum virgatum]|uniref:Uncharacterized protein n=1 Tax=Panicum virgatum TaxID=38727 RepID=A0A8T0SZ24_PANVG|nr:hypothetical protein PVAP13_5KG764900 [Panicum virgatum]
MPAAAGPACATEDDSRFAEYCDESPAWWSGVERITLAGRVRKRSHTFRVAFDARPLRSFSFPPHPVSGARRCPSSRRAWMGGGKTKGYGKAARGIPIPIPILTESSEEEVSRQRCRARGRPRDRPSSGAHMGAARGWQAGTGGKRQHRGVPSRRRHGASLLVTSPPQPLSLSLS